MMIVVSQINGFLVIVTGLLGDGAFIDIIIDAIWINREPI